MSQPRNNPLRFRYDIDRPIREEASKDSKLGAFYMPTIVVPKKRPEQLEVRAQHISFYTDFADSETLRAESQGEAFGRALRLEGYRRGVTQANKCGHQRWGPLDLQPDGRALLHSLAPE